MSGLVAVAPTGTLSSALIFEVAARVFKGITPCTCEPVSPEMAVPMTGWEGVVDFRGPGIGSIGVRVSTRYAEILATAMAGEDVRAMPAMQADAVGETANILSSSVMALLYGPRRHVTISSPKVTGDIADMPSGPAEGLVRLGLLLDHEHLVQVWLIVATEPAQEGTR